MKIEWNRVTFEHVNQACELFNSGVAQPKRPAQSTFLLLGGKTYPAKFIRGLSYHLATGVKLDPSRHYSGGQETIRFFQGLGLTTLHGSSSISSAPVAISDDTQSAYSPSPAKRWRKEPQKEALAALLRQRFAAIELEAQFPWLVIPPKEQMDASIQSIYSALQEMRRYSAFASIGRALSCDFFVPSERLIIEYDERQHFTMQRAKTLEHYPSKIVLGFDREEWLKECVKIHATDPSPPYRDEQRAFYDSLRDILAVQQGVKLIRLRHDAFDWTGPGASEQLDKMLSCSAAVRSMPTCAPQTEVVYDPTFAQIRNLALVSHDYNIADSRGICDFSEHFHQINQICDEHGCDAVMYSLWTWDNRSSVPRTYKSIFNCLSNVKNLILESGNWPNDNRVSPALEELQVEIWSRGQRYPTLAHQRFATSSSSETNKEAFINDLLNRRINNALLVICGETNISSVVRGSNDFYDPYHFARQLGEMNVKLVLNPIHDYMRRYEMREKRKYYSLDGKTVISVWNQGKSKESYFPWTVFHNGQERTTMVEELPRLFSNRPDIRIGIMRIATL